MRRDGSGDIMRGMEIKRQKPVFKEGDIVVNARNNFRRLIQSIRYEDHSGVMKVVYTYCDEELNARSMSTGNFDHARTGSCSQEHLMSWRQGRR
jgi:hypothetical protein